MSDTLTITAEQAATLPGPFVVKGELRYKVLPVGFARPDGYDPPAVFADADKPCPRRWCADGIFYAPGTPISTPCAVCYGTGRKVVELVGPWHKIKEGHHGEEVFGLFTIHVSSTPEPGGGGYLIEAVRVAT